MVTSEKNLLCCPKCKFGLPEPAKNPLTGNNGSWHCPCCGKTFRDEDGIINFLGDEEAYRSSERERIVREVYARFYTPLTNLMFLPCGGAYKARKEVLENLEIQPGATVLETGIGTGDNIPWLNSRLDGCTFHGLDNQEVMLQKCARNSIRWHLPLKLYRADAEDLPFRDNVFDVVFHLGAINLFRDKQHAIDEMIRVAKPGTKLVIADETEKASRLMALFTGQHQKVIPPVDLIPLRMEEIDLKTIWKGYGYLITFRKPA